MNETLMKIWLKGKEKPIEIIAPMDMVMAFTDWLNDNLSANHFLLTYQNRQRNKHLFILKSQVQAFEFDQLRETEEADT